MSTRVGGGDLRVGGGGGDLVLSFIAINNHHKAHNDLGEVNVP